MPQTQREENPPAEESPKKEKKKEKKKKGVLDIIMDIALALAIFLVLACGYVVVTNQEDPTEGYLFGFKPVYVITGSMEPTIKTDAVIIAKKIDYEDVKVDDIIVYKIEDKMITHRVIEKTDDGIRTKGDNNNVQDAYTLKEENIRAKVVLIMNFTAKLIPKMRTTEGKILYIIVPISAIMALYAAEIAIKVTRKKKKKSVDKPKKEKKKKEKKRKKGKEDPISVPSPSPALAEDFFEAEDTLKKEDPAAFIPNEIPIVDDFYEEDDVINRELFGSFIEDGPDEYR